MYGTIASILVVIAFQSAPSQPSQPRQDPPKQRSFLQGNVGMGLNPTRYPLIYVCRYPEVQTELKMSDSQKKKFAELDTKWVSEGTRIGEDFREQSRQLQDPADLEAHLALRAKLDAARAVSNAKYEAALRKVLDRKQFARLDQVHNQAEGPAVFTRPEIQERLFLDPERVKQVLAIVAEGEKELHQAALVPNEVWPTGGKVLTTEERRAKLTSKEYQDAVKSFRKSANSVRGQTMQRIGKALSRGEHAQFEKLVGEHFDFSPTWGKPAPQAPVASEPEPKGTKPTALK